jgi:hypothetical protein
MPTVKPRVQVSLSVPYFELLTRLAKLQRRSRSAVLSELFEQVAPVLERVAVVLQAAVRAQASARDGLVKATEDAEAEIAPFVNRAMAQLDLLQQTAEGGAEAAAGKAGVPGLTASALPRTPRAVTRGSGLPRTGGNARVSPRRAAGAGVLRVAEQIARAVRKGPVKVRKRRRKGSAR